MEEVSSLLDITDRYESVTETSFISDTVEESSLNKELLRDSKRFLTDYKAVEKAASALSTAW